jgi:hypothetical protein
MDLLSSDDEPGAAFPLTFSSDEPGDGGVPLTDGELGVVFPSTFTPSEVHELRAAQNREPNTTVIESYDSGNWVQLQGQDFARLRPGLPLAGS